MDDDIKERIRRFKSENHDAIRTAAIGVLCMMLAKAVALVAFVWIACHFIAKWW